MAKVLLYYRAIKTGPLYFLNSRAPSNRKYILHMLIKANTNPKQALSTIINEIKKGSRDSRHPYRYVSLATFDPAGEEPNIRMLINREITKDGTLTLYTDARTHKVNELKSLGKAALLFWHDHHKVQVTIKAEVAIHNDDDVAEEYWKSDVHGAAQKAYTPVVSPGERIENPSDAHNWPEEFTSEYFCVLKCVPFEMEILQLAGKEHLRLKFTRDNPEGEWQGNWIAP